MRISLDDKNFVEVRDVITFDVAGKVYKMYQVDYWDAGAYLLGELVTKIVVDGTELTTDLKDGIKSLPMALGTKAFHEVTQMYEKQMYGGKVEEKK